MTTDPNLSRKKPTTFRNVADSIVWGAAWAWTIVAGGGGLMMLLQKGPWPLSNGWFALFSGIAACPATAWAIGKMTGMTPRPWLRFGLALILWVTGRVALAAGI